MNTQTLDGDGWTVRAVGDLSGVPGHIRGRVFPARVPGCVHLDLIRSGVLGHPNLEYAEREQEWVGRTDWRYERRFVVEPGPGLPGAVRFDCLDTAATVELNGLEIGAADNFHRTHSFEVGSVVREGENLLAVTLAAPVPFVERAYAASDRPPYNGDSLGWPPFHMLRKPACNFGWDWGPRVATSGVQGSVCLSDGRIAVAWPTIDRRTAERWGVTVRVAGGLPARAELRLSLDGKPIELRGADSLEGAVGALSAHLESPRLWWPRGFGEQPLYDLELRGEGYSRRWRVGFRDSVLDTSPDAGGSRFRVCVNGRPVWCRGANWVPDALFPGEVTPERVRARVAQAVEANMNMLRVWGGGLYEQEAFYDACDELGVLVWQDFMFACAIYPEGDRPAAPVTEEAVHQVRRLSSHASLALWCGGNECVEGYQHWGWKERMGRGARPAHALYTETLPNALRGEGSATPYWPNSPWSGAVEDVRDPDHGDRHTWDLHFEEVRRLVPRFVSEFGRVAPACERTLWEAGVFDEPGVVARPRGALCAAPAWDDRVRAALEHRLRQTGGTGVAYDPVLPGHFGLPESGRGAPGPGAGSFRGWLWQAQVLQARALTTQIGWLRANSPRCMGALVWQLNDCWSCQSWSLVDHAGRPKPAWYAVRRAFEPRMATIQPMGGDGQPSAVLVNDTDDPFEGECLVRRVSFTGIELACAAVPMTAPPRGVGRVDRVLDSVGEPDDRAAEVLVVECADRRSEWFWERDLRLGLPESPVTAEMAEEAGRVVIRLHAWALARDIILAADLLGADARAAENCFTLLAGESRGVVIEGTGLDLGVGVGEVVRCASGPGV